MTVTEPARCSRLGVCDIATIITHVSSREGDCSPHRRIYTPMTVLVVVSSSHIGVATLSVQKS